MCSVPRESFAQFCSNILWKHAYLRQTPYLLKCALFRESCSILLKESGNFCSTVEKLLLTFVGNFCSIRLFSKIEQTEQVFLDILFCWNVLCSSWMFCSILLKHFVFEIMHIWDKPIFFCSNVLSYLGKLCSILLKQSENFCSHTVVLLNFVGSFCSIRLPCVSKIEQKG